jgi:hypothetical protein
MGLPARLYKTTIVIWSRYDGADVELHGLAYEAEEGDAYCTRQDSELITDPADFPDTDFFGTYPDKPEDEGPPEKTLTERERLTRKHERAAETWREAEKAATAAAVEAERLAYALAALDNPRTRPPWLPAEEDAS